MPDGDAATSPTSHEPKNSKFKQQALPAWQPILTAGTVLPTFFVIGVAFIPIGVGLMYFSNQVKEVQVDYTNCTNGDNKLCQEVITSAEGYNAEGLRDTCSCILKIKPDDFGSEDWIKDVFIYYGLTNFYQNHRRYVKSRDDKQLYGDLTSQSDDCKPFLTEPIEGGKVYAPCGAIANSLFNDTIKLEYCETDCDAGTSVWTEVGVTGKGIAWESDKEYKFRNPDGNNELEALKAAFKDTVKPKDWQKEIWDLDPTDTENNGFQNEDLIVWMRTAALPNFRKLYRKVVHSGTFAEGLPYKFKYRLNIGYNFEVAQFQGTKSVIISTTSILGGKNPFLGIAYIVVGVICFVMGLVFLFIHLRFGRTTQEMMNISPQSQYNDN